MHDVAGMKEMKRIDPIWKYLHTQYIWIVILFTLLSIYIIYIFTCFITSFTSISGICILSFLLVVSVIDQLKKRRYWLRIGQHRLQALNTPNLFRVDFFSEVELEQEMLSLPITLRLRIKNAWSALGAFSLAAAILTLVVGFFTVGLTGLFQIRNALIFLLFFACLCLLLAILFAGIIFFIFRYHLQSIQLTDDGITTCFMKQKRSLFWKEAQIFAFYTVGQKMIYELSNRQVVVRWSQSFHPFLVIAEHNRDREGDWNGLISRISEVVMKQAALPLHDLSDHLKT